jgi:hypothetical protein
MHKTLFCFSLLCTTLDAGALNDSPQHFQKLSSEMNNLNSLQNNLYFARVIEDTDAVQPKLIQPSPSAKNKPEQVEAEKKCTVEAEEKCTKETSCCPNESAASDVKSCNSQNDKKTCPFKKINAYFSRLFAQ